MPWVVAVSGLKGGVGKSTVALTLATTLHAAGRRVLIVDADPQGTARAWAARAAELGHEGPAVASVDGRQLRRDLPRLAAGAELVVIDTPPRLGADARAAMLASDLVLLPTTPGAADLWALQETLTVLAEAQSVGDFKSAVVLNRVDRTNLAAGAEQAVRDLGVAVLGAQLGARVAYGEAILAGLGVVQHAPGSTAADEAKALSRAVLRALGKAGSDG